MHLTFKLEDCKHNPTSAAPVILAASKCDTLNSMDGGGLWPVQFVYILCIEIFLAGGIPEIASCTQHS